MPSQHSLAKLSADAKNVKDAKIEKIEKDVKDEKEESKERQVEEVEVVVRMSQIQTHFSAHISSSEGSREGEDDQGG